ncbi:MAG: hypothetical protein QNJ41_06770 [Xenococcaceae cyanobacterium MO_188.B32]|nr:hypothetical protein [Xenococcaceae cyanobacterium MO_188.B32]
MRNLFKYSNLVVGSAAIALNLAVSSPQAMAFNLTWTLDNARFQDLTFATGSFKYDADSNTYGEVDITTTDSGNFPDRNYTESNSTISGDANSLVLNVGNETLTLNFQSPLTNTIETIDLIASGNSSSKEVIVNTPPPNFERKFIDGTVSASASVPFEFSPSLGIIACLCWFGIPMLKNLSSG